MLVTVKLNFMWIMKKLQKYIEEKWWKLGELYFQEKKKPEFLQEFCL